VQEELVLPPKQQVNVVARSTLYTPRRVVADSWVIESRQLRSGLYVGRTLLPSTHRDLLVRMINTTSEPQLLPINTCLGNLAPVEVLEGTASMLPATCGEQAATEKREQLAPINEAASVATGTEAAKSIEEIVEALTSKLPGRLDRRPAAVGASATYAVRRYFLKRCLRYGANLVGGAQYRHC
jgi:hypothetical protein